MYYWLDRDPTKNNEFIALKEKPKSVAHCILSCLFATAIFTVLTLDITRSLGGTLKHTIILAVLFFLLSMVVSFVRLEETNRYIDYINELRDEIARLNNNNQTLTHLNEIHTKEYFELKEKYNIPDTPL